MRNNALYSEAICNTINHYIEIGSLKNTIKKLSNVKIIKKLKKHLFQDTHKIKSVLSWL